MTEKGSLKEYFKYDIFAFFLGFGSTVWGGLTYYIGIPVAFLTYLDASSAQIGMVTTIFWGGFALPQIWAAYASGKLPIKKYYIGWSLIISSIAFLVMGIYILATGAVNRELSIWLFLGLFTWACLLAGLYIPGNFTLLYKVIPSNRLGQLLGIMFAIQFGGTFVSGPVMEMVNKRFPAPMNYAVLFIATFFITVLGCSIIMLLVKEPEGEADLSTPRFRDFMVDLLGIYKNDKAFIKYLVGKWLMSGHYVMMAFLLKFLLDYRQFNPDHVGWFSSLNGLGLVVGGFTITRIADIYGPKYMMMTSQLIAIIYTVIAWLVPIQGPWIIFAAFIITGMSQISDNVGYTNMCLFLCPIEDKSKYIAATNIGIIPFMVLLPVFLGWLMDIGLLSMNGTFTIAVGMMVAAIIYLQFVVKNPDAYEVVRAGS